MTIEERIIPCVDVERRRSEFRVSGWRFIGSDPEPGRDGFCRIRYDDKTAMAPAPRASAVQLSPHFTLAELTASQTAARKGLDNTPSPKVQGNLVRLANSLEAIREAAGKPVRISSGFRSEQVNKAVGGAPTSKHIEGLAADINIPGMAPIELALLVARMGLPFDQIILEYDSWVHVGLSDGPPRNELLTIRTGTGYMKGIV
jgi:zinc D-Ala-D-Ala carboxypeptidase